MGKQTLQFEYLLTPNGLEHQKRVSFDDAGVITAVESSDGGDPDGFLALPGMPNAHSHAFQRALCGYGERPTGNDSFWSWREAMYRLANAVDANHMYAIAARAFVDMLRGGFTSVGEFHYIHHPVDGVGGPDMALAVADAAADTGIRLTLLPVFYERGGFGLPPSAEQRRFVHDDLESYLRLVESLRHVPLGLAPHSLRAVDIDHLGDLVAAGRDMLGADVPIHIHVSEQRAEVDGCKTAYGTTPINLLAERAGLDSHWNLVHATHVTTSEIDTVVSANAAVILCPITEAYLGDGLMPVTTLRKRGGRIGIGSDSNVRIDAMEELRWLELGQRLKDELRSRLADEHGIGLPLWTRSCAAGAAALRQTVGSVEVGRCADLVVLDPHTSPLDGPDVDTLMDALIMGGGRENIASVYVGGRRVVDRGVHENEADVARRFGKTLRQTGVR